LGPGAVVDAKAANDFFVAQGGQLVVTISNGTSGLTYSVSSGVGSGMASSGIVASGTYTPGMSISVPSAGGASPMLSVSAAGEPAPGQSATFTLQPAGTQSIFQTFQNLIQALQAGSGSPGANTQRAQGISNALANLSQFQTTLLSTQATIGSELQQAQNVSNLNTNLLQQFQTTQGNLQDVSYPQVITQFQQSSTALQAAQKAFVQVQGLSLFQYI
jgi:flagellar hook-associated protein 3 FlgL